MYNDVFGKSHDTINSINIILCMADSNTISTYQLRTLKVDNSFGCSEAKFVMIDMNVDIRYYLLVFIFIQVQMSTGTQGTEYDTYN